MQMLFKGKASFFTGKVLSIPFNLWYTAPMDTFAPLLQWYDCNRRDLPWRHTHDPYCIWVSEIMLQQTRATAVIPYYKRFFEALPALQNLAACPQEELLKLWEGLGYYSRAKNLQKAAQVLVEKYQGAFPKRAEELQKLPGIGPYTAGAIASIAFGEPEPAVDGNVLRILSRLTEDGRDILQPATQKYWREYLKERMGQRPGDLNQSFMDLGSLVCLPENPKCEGCPLHDRCAARAHDTQGLLPVRTKKKPRRVEHMTVFVLRDEKGLWVRRRPAEGLLGGLYELPNVPDTLTPEKAGQQLTAWGLRLTGDVQFYTRKHIFTHVEWYMQVCACNTSGEMPTGYVRYTGKEPLPTAFLKCLPE